MFLVSEEAASKQLSDDLMTVEQAATHLKLKKQTLHNWRYERKGPPYYKCGSRVLYKTSELNAYLNSRRIDPEQS